MIPWIAVALAVACALIERGKRLDAERRWQSLTWWREREGHDRARTTLRHMREADRRVS